MSYSPTQIGLGFLRLTGNPKPPATMSVMRDAQLSMFLDIKGQTAFCEACAGDDVSSLYEKNPLDALLYVYKQHPELVPKTK